jgi:hypothetical protein
MSGERCDVAGCPSADDHFPVAQLILPLDLLLAAELLQAVEEACGRNDLQGVVLDLPGHGNGRLYARRRP